MNICMHSCVCPDRVFITFGCCLWKCQWSSGCCGCRRRPKRLCA